jgi:hypothetical protein
VAVCLLGVQPPGRRLSDASGQLTTPLGPCLAGQAWFSVTMKEELVAAGNEMARHGAAHGPRTHEAEIAHACSYIRNAIEQGDWHAVWVGREQTSSGQRRCSRGFVFASDRAAITEFIDATEEEWVVDLAGPGLVATGVVGELDMADAVKFGLDGPGNIALHYLRMVDIVLEADIARARRRDVDRLKQQPDPGGLEPARGIAEVLDQGGAGRVRG